MAYPCKFGGECTACGKCQKDPEYIYCDVCGKPVEYLFKDSDGDVVGCDNCIRQIDPYM